MPNVEAEAALKRIVEVLSNEAEPLEGYAFAVFVTPIGTRPDKEKGLIDADLFVMTDIHPDNMISLMVEIVRRHWENKRTEPHPAPYLSETLATKLRKRAN